jgi:hypothetical protein
MTSAWNCRYKQLISGTESNKRRFAAAARPFRSREKIPTDMDARLQNHPKVD